VDTTFVFADAHGNIGQMSAPQRSSGRLVSRRVPPTSGTPGNPATVGQTRAVSRARVPQPGKPVPAADLVVGEPLVPAPSVAEPGAVNDRAVNDRAVAAGRALNDRGVPALRPPGDGLSAGPHPVELAGLMHELSVRMLGADDVPQAIDRLAALVAGAVPGVLRCSVALIGEGGPLMLAASGTRAKALDDRQYGTGQGPGLEAARNRVLVTASELQSDPRWPELAESARAEGVHGVVSFPLDVQRTSVGSLSLFVGQPGGIAPELLLTTMAVVNQAEVLLGELRRREGLSEGATVDRAAGVIIAQRGCGVQEAYDVLRETAQRLGMDRRAVAERLIAAAARNAES
jgi:hypothetical protein